MLQYLKRQAMKLRSGLTKGIVLLLCLATLFSSAQLGGLALIAEAAEEGDTVTVTVNYVYESNSAMVAQPYTAQITKGAAFKKTIEVPYLFNYSIPVNQAVGLGDGIELKKDSVSDKYSLLFDLSAVNKDITVNLYYVAGQAKYTVKHYYQNLENDEYTYDNEVEVIGDIDDYTKADANNKPGFRCKGIPQTTIAADGTTVVEIYYDREYYTVTFDVSGGINGPEPIYAKYGTTFKVSDIRQPECKGYVFEGWFDPDGNPIAEDVAIEGNVTYTAQWRPEKAHADYTIVLWGQNANDDEYSYLSSHEAWGNVGNQVTWNEDTLISHVHTDKCWELTSCNKTAHMHTAACLTCGHTHTAACYGGTKQEEPVDGKTGSANENIAQFKKLTGGTLKNGMVYRVKCDGAFSTQEYDKYYLYYHNTWYLVSSSNITGSAVASSDKVNAHSHRVNINNKKDQFWAYNSRLSCGHTHTNACYTCGKLEHTHGDSCGTLICTIDTTPKYMREIQPDSKLWKLNKEKTETVTVDANGSTVLNVYFDRTEFTLTFKYGGDSSKTETIKDRWGANVKARFDAIEKNAKNSSGSYNFLGWKDSTTGYYTNNVMVMPQTDKTLTAKYALSGNKYTMTYYAADLNGDYEEIFKIVFHGGSVTVTEDEYYEWEGFTINKSRSSKVGDDCDGAKFYYDRNTYNLEFYSASNNKAEDTKNVKYQEPLSEYNYTPTQKPAGLEPDAVFVGWYLNPECTGEPFDLSAHVMPSHNIALYAKWVNGLFKVKTFTDETKQTPYKYDGYTGVQENIVKYTLATAPADPKRDGYVFIGWFYKDGEAEKPFSFTMPITKDYDLYPKFSEPKEVTYTVHYYKDGTEEKVASDSTNYVMIGTTVTEKAKMGKELDLVQTNMRNKYYPTNTSTSVIIDQIDQEITFYYTEANSVQYTVYYQDANRNNLIDPVTKTTEKSIVNEQYVPIPNYAPRQFSIMKELSTNEEENKIIFIYDPTLTTLTIQKHGCEDIDENQTFLFHVKGSPEDPNTKDVDLTVTIHGNGKTTVTDLPVGEYIITEETEWSWRYTPDDGAGRTFKAAIGGTNLIYQNSRTQTQWLDGDNYSVNHFDSKKQ